MAEFGPEDRKKLDEVWKAIVGDIIDPKAPPGILRRLDDHHEILYGNKEQKKLGTIEMVAILWEWKIKIVAVCGIISLLSSAPWLAPKILSWFNH
jgi:hypothetical protein